MKPLITLIISLCLFSCSKPSPVKWPALSELDNLSIKVEQAAYNHEHDEQKKVLFQIKENISKVTASLPENTHNPEKVQVLLSDLQALSDQITKLDSLSHEELDTLSRGIHPIIARLMETAGVPHVHAGSHEHDASTCTDPTHNH